MPVPEITSQELKRRLDAGEALQVLDVREPWEYAIAHLAGSRHIPLQELPRRLQELDPAAEFIVMCKVGGRSRHATEFLLAQGFARVSNLAGGIDAWTRDIDPALASY